MATSNFNQIQALLKNKDSRKLRKAFKALADFNEALPIPVENLLGRGVSIQRKSTRLTALQYFWESDLSVKFYVDFSTPSLMKELIQDFFNQSFITRKGRNLTLLPCHQPKFNLTFLQKVIADFPDLLKAVVRERELYKRQHYFIPLIKVFREENCPLSIFGDNLEAIQAQWEFIKKVKKECHKLIDKTPFHEWLVHFGHFSLKMLKQDITAGREFKMDYYGAIFDEILNHKIQKEQFKNVAIFKLIEINHETAKTKASRPDRFERYEEIITVYEACQKIEALLDTFSFDHNYDLKKNSNGSIMLFPVSHEYNKQWWWQNGLKYSRWYQYYRGVAQYMNDTFDPEKEFPGDSVMHKNGNRVAYLNTIASIERFVEYGIGEKVHVECGKLEVRKMLRFLNSFQQNSNGRFDAHFRKACLDEPSRSYLDIMFDVSEWNNNNLRFCNGGLRIDPYDTFVNNIVDDAIVDLQTAKSILKLMTYDVGKERGRLNIMETPFLRIGDLLVSFVSFTASQDMFITLVNRLLRPDGSQKKGRNKETGLMEKHLEVLFSQQGFKATSSLKLDKNGKTLGEIDCLAYKDNCLFLCEIKSTFVRTSLKEIYRNKQQALNKAESQLSKVSALLEEEEYFDKIRSALDVEMSYSDYLSGKLSLHPLIVSTSFEDDRSPFDKDLGVQKISLFELKVILANTKGFLFSYLQFFVEKFAQRENPEIINRLNNGVHSGAFMEFCQKEMKKKENIIEFNKEVKLYDGELTGERLVEIINKDLVWDLLEKYHEYDRQSHEFLLKTPEFTSKSNPQEDLKFYHQGMRHWKNKDFQKALECAEKCIQLCPEDAEYYKLSGNAKGELGDLKGSIEDMTQSIRIGIEKRDEMLYDYYFNRAVSNYQLEQFENALSDLDNCIKRKSDHAIAYRSKAVILLLQKRFEEAAVTIREARMLDPENRELQEMEMNTYFLKRKKFGKRYTHLDSIPKLLKRAEDLKTFGFIDKAIADYLEVLKIDSLNLEGLLGMAYCNFILNDETLALEFYLRACASHSGSGMAHSGAGVIFTNQKKYKEALKMHDRAILLTPNEGQFHYNRGVMFLENKQFSLAINNMEKALHLGLILNFEADASWNLSYAYNQQGKIEMAAQYAEKHRQLEKQLPQIKMPSFFERLIAWFK